MNASFLKIIALTVLTNCFTANGQTKEKNLFPPIDIKTWDKTPCVNGRLATKKETENGTALLYYDKKENAKPYNMTLPKLAYITKLSSDGGLSASRELVVVIQIVQTPKDTIVGYRPLTGSNGASTFRDFHFITDDEVKKVTGQ
jgi:hypothetical protein